MDQAISIQTAILKKMSPADKIKTAEKLFWNAFQLKMKWLEHKHPEWPQARLESETKTIFFYART